MPNRILEKDGAQIRVYQNSEELALKAARRFARLADQYVIGCGRFTVALSGGSTPKAMFQRLAESPFVETVPWSSIYFFWGDERCVPPDHADSNYRMTAETLLAKVPVPAENIFRIPAELADAHQAAQQYADTLLNFFLKTLDPKTTAPLSNVPRFDLIFLGMGADGHTASLFPHSAALHNDTDIVVANYVEKFSAHRITLTARTLNNARHVTFLVAGQDKAESLQQVLTGERHIETYPAQMIQPTKGTLLWLTDEAAASLL
ncbi:MAG: 6-phosphogluconolactonase [Acidobacteria bacterium]|nr:6-phosphogluconolactonase [Acidobacteriota bacterium]